MTDVFKPQYDSEFVKGIKDYFNPKQNLQQNYSNDANANWFTVGAISTWDVSKITTMKNAFLDRTFTEDIDLSSWNFTKVTDMSYMFKNAKGLEHVTINWNVSKITNMSYMFYGASDFNQNISTWDVSKVTDMSYMFYGATKFNQYISNWQTTAITTTTISNMFTGATLMIATSGSTAYKTLYGIQPTYTPNVSTVFNKKFTPYTNGVYTANLMFKAGLAYYFGGNISGLSNYGYTNSTIATAVIGHYSTNPTAIKNWDVSNVTDMTSAFNVSIYTNALSFNQNISSWDVSNVTDMTNMFSGATTFNQNIRYWCINTTYDVTNMFNGATIMLSTYSSTIAITPDITKFFYVFTPQSNTEFTNGLLDYFSLSTSLLGTYSSNSNAHINRIGKYNTTPSIISRWNVSKITSMNSAFKNKTDFNEDISNWDVSNVTDMSFMFACDLPSPLGYITDILSVFNCDITSWNVSNVTNMSAMFKCASSFNQDLSSWNVSKVVDFSSMFYYAISFNNDISTWLLCSSLSINMNCMFYYAIKFNQSVNTNGPYWNITKVTIMANMFNGATDFNKSLSNWDVSKVTDMSYMFNGTNNFNKSLSNWNVSSVTSFAYMFGNAIAFDQNICYWAISTTTNVTVTNMFIGATQMLLTYSLKIANTPIISTFFNVKLFTPSDATFKTGLNYYFGSSSTLPSGYLSSDIGNWSTNPYVISTWNVSNVTDMSHAFNYDTYSNALSFNQNISDWNVSKVTTMHNMFSGAKLFNQDISNWNVSKVIYMELMFYNASSFNQDISKWNVSNVFTMYNMFQSATNFNQDISKWNVSNVGSMDYMFKSATKFNQNIRYWNVKSTSSVSNMFYKATAMYNEYNGISGYGDTPSISTFFNQ